MITYMFLDVKHPVKSQNCVFSGYYLDGARYKFYYVVMKKLIRCCDVDFIEDKQLTDIDRISDDDPTHDEDREKCHDGEMQLVVEHVAL